MIVLPSGTTIGIIGSGQLGRMLAVAAAQLGYRVHVYAPERGPANDVCAVFTQGDYADVAALERFAGAVDVVTYEFENIAGAAIAALGDLVPVRPGVRALEVAQDRVAEKSFVNALGGRTAVWRAVADRAALDAALVEVGVPAILKTTRFGYDGKGQARLATVADAETAWAALGGAPAILEGVVPFRHEFSVLLARGADGATVSWPPPLNIHHQGILARSLLPAPAAVQAQWGEAAALTRQIADALDYVGVLACEFFAGEEGPVFNEMAPRVHNSGHWTIEGAITSQFENHIRAICGQPLGDTGLTAIGIEMENLIGTDIARAPDLLRQGDNHVHLYGKHEARPGRKMGHFTRLRRE